MNTMNRISVAFLTMILGATAQGGSIEKNADVLVKDIRSVIPPEGWTVTFNEYPAFSELKVSRDEALRLDFGGINLPPGDNSQDGQYAFSFFVSGRISNAEYTRLKAENAQTEKEMMSLYDQLVSRHVSQKFDNFFPEAALDKVTYKRYQTLKKLSHELPDLYFQGISLETPQGTYGETPWVIDPKIREQCDRVHEAVLKLLSRYDDGGS